MYMARQDRADISRDIEKRWIGVIILQDDRLTWNGILKAEKRRQMQKTKDSKKREQPREQSQGTYLHTVVRERASERASARADVTRG